MTDAADQAIEFMFQGDEWEDAYRRSRRRGGGLMATVDFDDEDAVLAAMAHELDIDPDELRIKDSHLTDFGAGTVYEVTIRGSKNGKEWFVVDDDDQEHELAVAMVKQDLEE